MRAAIPAPHTGSIAAAVKKEILYGTMEKEGVKTVDRGNLKITYVAPSCRTSVDSKKLEKEEPEIFKKYAKTTTVAGSIKITLMEEKKNG